VIELGPARIVPPDRTLRFNGLANGVRGWEAGPLIVYGFGRRYQFSRSGFRRVGSRP
jgi:hypothetical protein